MKLKYLFSYLTFFSIGTITITIPLASCSNNKNITQEITFDEKISTSSIKNLNNSNINAIIKQNPFFLTPEKELNLFILPNLEVIESNVFKDKKITKINFGNNSKIKTIEKYAFENNELSELIFPNAIENVGEGAFKNSFLKNTDSKIVFRKESNLKFVSKNAFLNENSFLKIYIEKNNLFEIIKNSGFDENLIFKEGMQNTGGSFNGLYTDNNIVLCSLLGLTNTTQLSSLTNDILTNRIKKIDHYSNTTISIQDESSEDGGILKLKVTNTNSKTEDLITISGFRKITKDLTLNQIEINKNQWFEDKKVIDDAKNITSNEWIKYLSKIEVIDNSTKTIYNLADKNQNTNLTLSFQFDEKSRRLTIKAKSEYKKYSSTNNQWIKDDAATDNFEEKEIRQQDSKAPIINFPDANQDFFNFLLKNKIIKNQNHINTKYASYYLHWDRYNLKTQINNLISFPNEFIEYGTKLGHQYIRFESEQIYANDFDGVLYVYLNLVSESYKLFGSYTIDGFIKLDEKLFVDHNPVIPLNRFNKSFENYLRGIKKNISLDEIKSLNDSKPSINVTNLGFIGTPINSPLNNTIQILKNNEYSLSSKEETLKKAHEKFSLEDNLLPIPYNDFSEFDATSNLYKDLFVINSIAMETNMLEKATLEKINHLYFYKIPITISYSLNKNSFGNNEEVIVKTLNGKMSITLFESDLFNK